MIVERSIKDLIEKDKNLVLSHPITYQTALCGFYNNYLITILPSYKCMLPYTIIVNQNEFTRLKNEAQSESVIICFPEPIIFQKIYVKKNPLSATNKSIVLTELHNFLSIFQIEENSLSIKLEEDKENAALVRHLITALQEENMNQTKNIVGKGMGLTPSMDDFILGIYSFLIAQGDIRREKMLADYIRQNLEKTTLVSRFALQYAINSHLFPHSVSDFYKSWKVIDLLPLLKHGSSSGMDLATGIYYGIKFLYKEMHNV